MLNNRKFSFVIVTASRGGEGKTVVEPDAEVTYSGKKVVYNTSILKTYLK
jgi:hypothetical protein